MDVAPIMASGQNSHRDAARVMSLKTTAISRASATASEEVAVEVCPICEGKLKSQLNTQSVQTTVRAISASLRPASCRHVGMADPGWRVREQLSVIRRTT